MMRRRFLAARVRYRCQWKCTRCGRINRERGEVHAADRVAITPFTDNLYDEVCLSGELAQGKARKKLHRLQEAVNGRHALAGLRVSGICRRCARQQFWAPALRHTWAAVAAAACFAAILGLTGLPVDGLAWFACLGASALAALLAEAASLTVTRWRLGRLADPEYAPFVEELFPEA